MTGYKVKLRSTTFVRIRNTIARHIFSMHLAIHSVLCDMLVVKHDTGSRPGVTCRLLSGYFHMPNVFQRGLEKRTHWHGLSSIGNIVQTTEIRRCFVIAGI